MEEQNTLIICKRITECENGKLCSILRKDVGNVQLLGCSLYVPKKPQTNEEYLRNCSTEELAKLLMEIYRDGRTDRCKNVTKWYERCETNCELWLKEKHMGD